LFPVRYEDEFFDSLTGSDWVALVMEDGDKIVGVSTGQLKKKATDFFGLGFATLTVFYLATFGIDASHRRRGLGNRLFAATMEQLRNCSDAECLVLHVKVLNEAAQKFYLANGLKNMKVKPNHYHNIGGRSFDAVKMGLKIAEKSESYLFPPPSLLDSLYEMFCCPVASELLEDDKSK
jgi:ribosomal protein S18 acetylase RimI-like enzyme